MVESTKVGIEKIGIYIPKYFIGLDKLAKHRGIEPEKWTRGIGQENMAVVPIDQDIVSMGANACINILDEKDKQAIDQVIFATESSYDFSKASSTYIHKLLGIQEFAKSYEIKQACYSCTAAIQIANDYIRLRPDRKVLIISSDISKYGLKSSGEATQGAGALAILMSSNPKVLELSNKSVSFTENSFDFWRPSYSDYPIVEGKTSIDLYINVFSKVIEEFSKRYPNELEMIDALLFHLPFSKMGLKALRFMEDKANKGEFSESEIILKKIKKWYEEYDKSIIFGKEIGNIYTGSLYLGLLSTLINSDLKDGSNIGFFSYGSGAVAEFFTGKLSENYKNYLYKEDIESLLDRRVELTIDQYEESYVHSSVNEYVELDNTKEDIEEGFYLEKVEEDKRIYNFRSKNNK